MGWTEAISHILRQYENPTSPPPQEVNQHYDSVAAAAPASALSEGLSTAFRSEQTPSFGQMVSQLFTHSNPEQKAGILNQIMGSGGSGLGGFLAGKGLSGLLNSEGRVSAEAASQVPPDSVAALADRARQKNPSIVETVSSFYAQHPTLVKVLGAAALSMAMSQTAAASASAGPAAPQARTYTVQPGDNLSKISKQFYGSASEYMKIFEANRDKLSDPDKIKAGITLSIP